MKKRLDLKLRISLSLMLLMGGGFLTFSATGEAAETPQKGGAPVRFLAAATSAANGSPEPSPAPPVISGEAAAMDGENATDLILQYVPLEKVRNLLIEFNKETKGVQGEKEARKALNSPQFRQFIANAVKDIIQALSIQSDAKEFFARNQENLRRVVQEAMHTELSNFFQYAEERVQGGPYAGDRYGEMDRSPRRSKGDFPANSREILESPRGAVRSRQEWPEDASPAVFSPSQSIEEDQSRSGSSPFLNASSPALLANHPPAQPNQPVPPISSRR